MITKVYHTLFGFAYKSIALMATAKIILGGIKMLKKKKTAEEEFKEGMLHLMASELEEIYCSSDDVAKTNACLRLHRLQEDYNKMKELDIDDKKSKRELASNIVAPTVTAAGGILATIAWINFEKTEVVTGASGKEILRQVVGTIFKKK